MKLALCELVAVVLAAVIAMLAGFGASHAWEGKLLVAYPVMYLAFGVAYLGIKKTLRPRSMLPTIWQALVLIIVAAACFSFLLQALARNDSIPDWIGMLITYPTFPLLALLLSVLPKFLATRRKGSSDKRSQSNQGTEGDVVKTIK